MEMLKDKIDKIIQEESKALAENKSLHSKSRLDVLRLIKAELVTAEKKCREYTLNLENSVLVKMLNERQEAANEYNKYGREDLARKELYELEVISEFAPKLPNDDELREFSKELVENYSKEKGDEYILSIRDMKPLKSLFSQKYPYSDVSSLVEALKNFINDR